VRPRNDAAGRSVPKLARSRKGDITDVHSYGAVISDARFCPLTPNPGPSLSIHSFAGEGAPSFGGDIVLTGKLPFEGRSE
jgi:hypothetical protein